MSWDCTKKNPKRNKKPTKKQNTQKSLKRLIRFGQSTKQLINRPVLSFSLLNMTRNLTENKIEVFVEQQWWNRSAVTTQHLYLRFHTAFLAASKTEPKKNKINMEWCIVITILGCLYVCFKLRVWCHGNSFIIWKALQSREKEKTDERAREGGRGCRSRVSQWHPSTASSRELLPSALPDLLCLLFCNQLQVKLWIILIGVCSAEGMCLYAEAVYFCA